MIVANFFHINASNGLFYYGLDYVREHLPLVRRALVKPPLAEAMREALPGIEVVACDGRAFLREILRARRAGDFLFTPTSHPLPGISRQWIVLHDAYPFAGRRGLVKRLLFRASLASSRCKVAYINRSAARDFVAHMGVDERRQVFAPNRFPASPREIRAPRARAGGRLVVGLVGSDSPKKNYAQLFAAVEAAGVADVLAFRVYGHRSAYFEEVATRFPGVDLALASSDELGLDDFFARVDVLASVADQEGFGRPIAAALLGGVPCFLLDGAVFREFFAGAAQFFPDAAAVAAALGRAVADAPAPPRYAAPAAMLQAYETANAELRRLGSAVG